MIREEDKKKVMDIAIVDDNRLWQKRILDSILSCFEDEPPTIRIFSSGEQLIRASIPFTAVFLDFEMSGINGFDTALSYGGLFPDSYLILLTEHGEFSRKGYLVNAFRYIEKAYMDEEIPEALSAIGLLEDPGGEITVQVYHEGLMTIREKHIICVETIPHGSLIHTKDRDYRAAIPIRELEQFIFPNRFIAVFLFIIAFQTKPKRKRARNFVHFLSSFRLRFGISFPYKMMIVRSFGFRVHYSVVVPLFKWDLVSFA